MFLQKMWDHIIYKPFPGLSFINVKSAEVKNLLQGISEDELKDFEEQTEDLGDVLMTN